MPFRFPPLQGLQNLGISRGPEPPPPPPSESPAVFAQIQQFAQANPELVQRLISGQGQSFSPLPLAVQQFQASAPTFQAPSVGLVDSIRGTG